VTAQTQADLTARLLPGERLVWSAQPSQGIRFQARDILLIPFSLLWGGFAIFWESTVLAQQNAPFIFQLWGIPFVLAGIFIMFGRFLLDAHIRARLTYAITDRRILIVRSGWFPAFTTLDRQVLPIIELVEGLQGRGTLYFGQTPSFRRLGWIPALDPTPKFVEIEDAQSVLALLTTPQSADPGSVIPLRALSRLGSLQNSPMSVSVRPNWFILLCMGVALLVPVTLIAWNSVFCISSGGADVRAVRSFATTQDSFDRGDRAPATKFAAGDTAMALVVLNWPNRRSSAGWHRIDWKWYRDDTLVSETRRCRMHFTDSPYTLWTWRRARDIGPGHYRVDTLIDGELRGTTEFDITAAPTDAR
jgi:hypothetical protein